ncbi:MAG: inositol-3-phosphate synthase [Planctomycetota bacterium]
MTKRREKIGLWLIGACGGVGSTTALGIAALRKRLADTIGLITELPPFHSVGLVDPGSIIVGGHEIRSETLLEAVNASHGRAGLFSEDLIRACAPRLRAMQRNVRTGTLYGSSPGMRKLADRSGLENERCPAEAIQRLSRDITAFRERHRLHHVVVVHIASSEPPSPHRAAHRRYAHLQRELGRSRSKVLPSSSLYALAAIEARCPFINFTPSLGLRVEAIQQRATELDVPYMGSDGKTGETLVKSILAPMFAMRNLSVLSWVGQNILGNRDGAVLQDPRTRTAKLQSKDKTVSQIVGRSPTTHVSIDYVPSLDDWKIAWDFIHFQGFLNTKMSLQFTWQGSDSILAAPLIIDLARLAALECRSGRGGPMRHLACFFKDPIAVREQNYFIQWQRLLEHVARVFNPCSAPVGNRCPRNTER